MALFERNDMVVRNNRLGPALKVIGYDSVGRVLTGRFEDGVWTREDIPEDELCLQSDWIAAQPAMEITEDAMAELLEEQVFESEVKPAAKPEPEKRHVERKPLSTNPPEPKAKPARKGRS